MPQLKTRCISPGNAAFPLQPVEQLWALPGGFLQYGLGAGRQHARHVFGETAAGDVGHALMAIDCINASTGFT